MVWVLLKSTQIKSYNPYYYINLVSFWFKNLNHKLDNDLETNFKNSKFYLFENFINCSKLDEIEIASKNKSFTNLIKNLYRIDRNLELKLRTFIINESQTDKEFHPQKSLILEIKEKNNAQIQLKTEIQRFASNHKLVFQEISKEKFIKEFKDFYGVKSCLRERKDLLKTKFKISKHLFKKINLNKFSLDELNKHISSKSEIIFSIKCDNYESKLRIIKFKKLLLKNLNLT